MLTDSKEFVLNKKMDDNQCTTKSDLGKSSKKMWNPRIHVTKNTTGLMIRIYPPFKTAAYHLICVENTNQLCIGGKLRVNKTDDRYLEEFVQVPSNRTYRVLVRPCDPVGNPLDEWVSDNHPYHIEPTKPVTSSPPVTERFNRTSPLHAPESLKLDQPLTIVLLSAVAILFLIATVLLVVFLRRRNCAKKHSSLLKRFCPGQIQEETGMMRNHQQRDNNSVIITPILLQQPEVEKNMVKAHLKLLEKQDGISVNPTPFLSAEFQEISEISKWIDNQISLALQHDNHFFIIYSSDNLKITFTEPDIFHENLSDQICVKFIKKLTSQNIPKRVLGVCFGNSDDYNCLPFTKFHKMFSGVKLVGEETRCPAVSFSGTIDLIKHLLSSQTDYSFNSDETNPLRLIFLRSQRLMSRSLDDFTTGYESDSELSPFIHDNGTFVGPDSIAGSQSDLNAEMNGLNKRAGWPDVC